MTSAALEVDFVVRQAFLSLIARGEPVTRACKRMGVSRKAINSLIASDPEFAEDYHEAMTEMVERVDHVAYDRAIDGDFKFVELFMKRHHPEIFTPKGMPGGRGQAPQISVAHLTVQIAQGLLMGPHSQDWMSTIHATPEAIEATASEPDVQPDP